MASVDVTVRGGGIFGLSVAWACARAGGRVRVIDTAGIGAGASGGIVGALAPHAPDGWNPLKQVQLDSLLMAAAWWAAVQGAGGVDPLYLRSGRLQPLADDAAVAAAQARIAGAAAHWRGSADWQVVPATGAAWEPASPTGLLVHDTLTARIFPRTALAALTAALRATGAELVTGDAPEQGAVVHATGVQGLADLNAAAGRNIGAGVKGQAVLLAHDAGALPQIYAPGLHVVAHGNGTVAVGSTSENQWDQPGPDHQADDLIARARAVLPVLQDAPVLERWAGIRPRAATRQPIAGPWPGRPGHFIANGGFKIGFGMAPLIAEGLAAQILTGTGTLPEAFRPAF